MTDKEIFELEDQLENLKVQQAKDEAKLMELRAKNAEKLAKRRLNAHEARDIADNGTRLLSQIYKVIRNESEEGRVRIDWCVDNVSDKCKERLIKELELDGFKVSEKDDTLIIQW